MHDWSVPLQMIYVADEVKDGVILLNLQSLL
jgi:hypothetical protein